MKAGLGNSEVIMVSWIGKGSEYCRHCKNHCAYDMISQQFFTGFQEREFGQTKEILSRRTPDFVKLAEQFFSTTDSGQQT